VGKQSARKSNDMAESELAVLTTQCLSRRIPDKQTPRKKVAPSRRQRQNR